MDKSGNKQCDNFSKYNSGQLVYLLLDKHLSSEEINDSQEINKISIQTSKSTVNLDNFLKRELSIYSYGINNLFQINILKTSSEKHEWESIDEKKSLELQQLYQNQYDASVIQVEERFSNKNIYNFNRNIIKKNSMQELSGNDET
ncbi:hypothetical protein GLOIN_2v1838029 [Rhizophagus clarus]|uniref:Uncharacterized protein n=1 Tax=Rhizophagus clarus TaxID=94130 RepID=A0A8H3QHY3_9GLOM|nr:hypothetical protein GLOIN_2v1838029 [Rhizophagus clarus]